MYAAENHFRWCSSQNSLTFTFQLTNPIRYPKIFPNPLFYFHIYILPFLKIVAQVLSFVTFSVALLSVVHFPLLFSTLWALMATLHLLLRSRRNLKMK